MTGTGTDTPLLAALRKELAEKILPKLEGEDRYTGAMMKRALDVLAARAEHPDPADVLAEAGHGTPEALAARLRGEATAAPELAAALRTYVEAKLRISNPEFLAVTAAAATAVRKGAET